MTKILWVGGPHGVGKSSSISELSNEIQNLNYLYLGRFFYETAEKIGFAWKDLEKETNLLAVENIVTPQLKELFSKNNFIVDSHYAIHIGQKVYPGYHGENLRNLFESNLIKKGLVRLVANPETILKRRNNSKKRFKAYPTEEDLSIISSEISASKKYFDYFVDSLMPNVSSIELNNSDLSLDETKNKLKEFYYGL